MAMTIAQLKTELTTDPKTLGYGTLRTQSNGPEAVAAKINQIGASAETITRTYVPIEDVVAAIVRADYDLLAAAGKAFLNDVLLTGTRVKTGDANLRASMSGLFGAGTTTRTNLVALATRSASRGEALWGEGTTVTAQQVADAWVS